MLSVLLTMIAIGLAVTAAGVLRDKDAAPRASMVPQRVRRGQPRR